MKRYNSNWCVFLVFCTQFCSFIPFSVQVSILNSLTPYYESFINATHIIRHNVSASDDYLQVVVAVSQSSLIVGTFFGCLMAHNILGFFSRKTSLALSHCAEIFSGVMMSFATVYFNSFEIFIFGRFLNGITRGIMFTLLPLYVAELVHRKTLGMYQSFGGATMYLGVAFGNILGLPKVLGNISMWHYAVVLPVLLSAIFLSLLPWFPQTPSYLFITTITKNTKKSGERINEVYVLLQQLRSVEKDEITNEYNSIINAVKNDSILPKSLFCDIIHSKDGRKLLFSITFLMLSFQFSGIQGVVQYTNKVFENAGVGAEEATLYATGLSVMLSAVCFLSSPAVLKFGSKTLLLIGVVIIILGLSLLTISTFLKNGSGKQLSIFAMFLYFIGVGIGPVIALFSLPSELTTQQTRPVILWFGGLAFWIFASAVAFFTPFLLRSIGGFTYIIFIFLLSLEIVFVWIYIPNTRNKTVSEVQVRLQANSWRNTKFYQNLSCRHSFLYQPI